MKKELKEAFIQTSKDTVIGLLEIALEDMKMTHEDGSTTNNLIIGCSSGARNTLEEAIKIIDAAMAIHRLPDTPEK